MSHESVSNEARLVGKELPAGHIATILSKDKSLVLRLETNAGKKSA
jgi:hypothetical protein